MLAKLIKLLRLTRSTNDNEALLAIRKANQLIQRKGLDWDQIILETLRVRVGDVIFTVDLASQIDCK